MTLAWTWLYFTSMCLLGLGVMGSLSALLTLLAAACLGARTHSTPGPDSRTPCLRFAVIVPAHNEEEVLDATLASLLAQDYPSDAFEIVVIADNCTDATPHLARKRSVTVLERHDLTQRGKGYALAWAFEHLLAVPQPADAFAIVDADTFVAPDFLAVMAQTLRARTDAQGRCALQGRYGVQNTSDGWRAALMAAAFDLVNHVRPQGVDRLGLSVSLKGNGMVFTRAVAQSASWSGKSVTEDLDYGLELLRRHHVRVGYVPQARVWAQMPITGKQAASQRERWEGGRYRLVRERGVGLVWEGVKRRQAGLLWAGIELLLPPLAEWVALLLLWGAGLLVGVGLRLWAMTGLFAVLWLASAAGLLLYLLGGLWAAGASREVYVALLRAPGYVVWKLALYAGSALRGLRGKGEAEWVRTQRIPVAALSPGTIEMGQEDQTIEAKKEDKMSDTQEKAVR